MRGLLKLTWLEIRIFVREPLGFVAAVGVPLALFLVLGRTVNPGADHSAQAAQYLAQDLPLFLSIVIASMVATARFAQLIGSAIFYPMLAVSGMLVPLSSLPPPWALLGNLLPMSHAVALLRGAWVGASWLVLLPHLGVLALTIVLCL